MPSASPLETHTLLLLLLPCRTSCWGRRPEEPAHICVSCESCPKCLGERGDPCPCSSSCHSSYTMFSLRSKVALLKSSTCPSATDTSLPNTTAREALLFSLVLPSCCRGAGTPTRSPPAPPHLVIALSPGAWHLLKLPTLCPRSCWAAGPEITRSVPSTECALAPEQVLRMYFGVLLHVWVQVLWGCK